MYTIRSTYDEWAPEFDQYPDGRQWPGEFADYYAAWCALEGHLFGQQWWHAGERDSKSLMRGLAPYGHTDPTARYGDTTIVNDAETITISAQ